MTPWTLARTRPSGEAFAAGQLGRAGIAHYLPRFWDAERACRRALFPAYIFAHNTPRLRTTIGIRKIVAFGEEVAAVPEQVIAELRQRENEHGNVMLEPLGPKPGDRVTFKAGPFRGQLGIYQGQSAKQRVTVLLELLGQCVPVCVPRRSIELAA